MIISNWPNPFRTLTRIHYSLPVHTPVSIDVFNLQGQRVATLVHADQGPGVFAVAFEPGAANPRHAGPLPAGVYFCRLQAGAFSGTRKMLLLR